MGFFSRAPSLRQIDQYSIEMIESFLGGNLNTGSIDEEQMHKLLDQFADYCQKNRLGILGKSKIIGNIELFLSQTVPTIERQNVMAIVRVRLS